jgi:CRP/FNR family cyclic AMP-dependent transcriptional regulator
VLRKDAKIDLIRRVPLFERCSKRELALVASVADEIDVTSGTTLTREGTNGREFVVLVDGTAEVTRSGRKINELGSGDFLGEIALVSKRPRTATVTTTSNARMLVVTDRAFGRLHEESPSLQAKVLQALADRLNADAV